MDSLNDALGDLTVGDLKKLIAKLSDDMPIVGVDGHTGEEDNLAVYVEDDKECFDKPTLVMNLG